MDGREAVLLKPVGMLVSVPCSGECAQQTVVSSFSSVDQEGRLSSSLLPCGGHTNNCSYISSVCRVSAAWTNQSGCFFLPGPTAQ